MHANMGVKEQETLVSFASSVFGRRIDYTVSLRGSVTLLQVIPGISLS